MQVCTKLYYTCLIYLMFDAKFETCESDQIRGNKFAFRKADRERFLTMECVYRSHRGQDRRAARKNTNVQYIIS